MCEQCCAEADGYGEFIPGYFLCRAKKDGHWMKKDDWGIVITNDPSFIFQTTPIKDLTYHMSDEHLAMLPDDDPLCKQWRVALDVAQQICNEMLRSIHDEGEEKRTGDNIFYRLGKLFQAMTQAGYRIDKHGSPACWLCQRMAEHLEANPKPIWPYEGPSMEI